MIVEAFGRSAANFQAAGYDGIEISRRLTATSWRSFSRPRRIAAPMPTAATHSRGERVCFVEIVEEIRARCGPDYPLGVRLSADEHTPGGLTIDDTLEIVDALQESAPVDYISITTGHARRVRQGLDLRRGLYARHGRGREAGRRRAGDGRGPDPVPGSCGAGARLGAGRLRRRRPRGDRRRASG